MGGHLDAARHAGDETRAWVAGRAAVSACPSCRAPAPDGARFCPACGSAVATEIHKPTERKVVTMLFADLVGFTALGERYDPEDVDAALRSYYEMARTVIECFGGVVEKFIGDAVVGLFGVPTAHEDDAERAVRAALEIVARMRELPGLGDERLLVRAAVNSGPALVRLHVLPSSGEGILVGDAVNTAARLLAAAPEMAVVVGATTHRHTQRTIAYEPLPAAIAKGKSTPVERWVARGAIARRGVDADLREEPAMIGREVELGILSGLLDRAIASGSPQVALLTGEAGIGKSRLLRELFHRLDARQGFFCSWRQGRCPPYGDGLAYWALGEIVRGHAGILPSDGPVVVEQKLARAVTDGGQEEWILSRLRPLVGLPGSKTDREESFAAWTRFFEDMARTRPTVLVVEDLHWASEPTLGFLNHFVRGASEVPLLLIGTARLELLEDHPDVMAAASCLTRLGLTALSPQESTRLATSLLHSSAEPGLAAKVAGRCGGNPLFAEELVRYLAERQESEDGNEASQSAASEAPATILALIAARLDALPADQKAILAEASVVGPIFSPDAVAAAGGRAPRDVEQALNELEQRQMVRRHADPAAGGRAFAFWHALTREVAYGQMTREARAFRHAALAWWLERTQTVTQISPADLLADHYATAFDYATASGRYLLAKALIAPAVRHLVRAGDEALVLDVSAAERHYRRAVTLSPLESRALATSLVRWGDTLMQGGQLQQAQSALQDGVNGLLAHGEVRQAAVAMTRLAIARGLIGDRDGRLVCETARSLIEEDGDSPELVTVLVECAATRAFNMETTQAIEISDRALAMAARLDLPTPARALHFRGMSRFRLGQPEALEDYRMALALAEEQGQGRETATLYHNLAEELLLMEGPPAALETRLAGLDFARRRHDETAIGYLSNGLVADHFWGGDWDEALAVGAGQPDLLGAQDNLIDLTYYTALAGLVLCLRGQADESRRLAALTDQVDPMSLEADACLTLLPYLAASRLAAGQAGAARALIEQLVERARLDGSPLTIGLPLAVRVAATTGAALVQAVLAGATTPTTFRDHAVATAGGLLKEARGEHEAAASGYAEAAARWEDLGVPFERAQALRGQGRCLSMTGRASEARAPLEAARAIFARLRAAPDVEETEAILARVR